MNSRPPPPRPAADTRELRLRLRAHEEGRGKQPVTLRFGLYEGRGVVRGDEDVVALCADLYNHRTGVAAGLRLAEALAANPECLARLGTAGCTCGSKTPDPAYHEDLCVYAAAVGALPDAG